MQERRTLATSIESENNLLDVLFSSNDGSLLKIFKLENWPDSGWTPIGIVVVPTSHNRYGDGSCGIMSLRSMSKDNPNEGVASSSATASSLLTTFGTKGKNFYGTCMFLGPTNTINNIPYQNSSSSLETVSNGTAVWPFAGTITLPEDGPSTEYTPSMTTTYEGGDELACDFNGIKNCAALLKWAKSHSAIDLYDPDTSGIGSSTTTNYSQAAACCIRFSTIGTLSFYDIYGDITTYNSLYGTVNSPIINEGFWYLPGLGELCYLAPKKFEINKVITDLNTKYGVVGTLLFTDLRYWASTGNGSNNQTVVNLSNGAVGSYGKANNAQVRAFTRFGSTRTVIDEDASDIALKTHYFGEETITKSPEASVFNVMVTCNNDTVYGAMTISTQDSWITASQLNTNIRISITENTTLSNRTGYINVTYDGYSGTINIILLGGTITLSPDSNMVGPSAGTISTTILLDNQPLFDAESITISTNDDWIKSTNYNLNTGDIDIVYSANISLTSRRTSIITISYIGLTLTFTLNQEEDDYDHEGFAIISFDASNVTCEYEPANVLNGPLTNKTYSFKGKINNDENGSYRFIDYCNWGCVNIRNIQGLQGDLLFIEHYKSGRVVFSEMILENASILVLDILNVPVNFTDKIYFPGLGTWNTGDVTFVPSGVLPSYTYTDIPIYDVYHYDLSRHATNYMWTSSLPTIGAVYNSEPLQFSQSRTYYQTLYPGLTGSFTISVYFDLYSNMMYQISRTGLSLS